MNDRVKNTREFVTTACFFLKLSHLESKNVSDSKIKHTYPKML